MNLKITIESTNKVIEFVSSETVWSPVPARVWEGHTESGIPVVAFITRIAVHRERDQSQFEEELKSVRNPSADMEAIPLRLIL